MVCEEFLILNNGVKMPALGVGTWQASEKEVENAIDVALTIGYRHIDTAQAYCNEKEVGCTLKKWINGGKVSREDLFITTKLSPPAVKSEAVESSLRKSLKNLQLTYVDLYLVHTPFNVMLNKNDEFLKDDQGLVPDCSTDHKAIWKVMEEIYHKGLAKSIGLSNFNMKQIQGVLNSCTIPPANLQIEYHVYLQQTDLIDFCRSKGITVTAYSPLGSQGLSNLNKQFGVERELPKLLEVPEVKEIAAAHNKTPAQVLIKWILQHGLAVIPKSCNPQRLKENFQVFDFSLLNDEMQIFNSLNKDFRICDFGFFQGVERHPEFPFKKVY